MFGVFVGGKCDFNLRLVYAAVAILVVALGLASRRYLPVETFLIGSILWSIMLFFLVATVLPRKRTIVLLSISFPICVFVEVIHLTPYALVDQVRSHWFGYLVLGKGFSSEDLIWYVVGLAFAWYLRDRVLATYS